MKNNLIRYNKTVFADKNVVYNGSYNFNNKLVKGEIEMFNKLQETTLIINNFFSAIKVISSKPLYNVGVDKVDIYVSYSITKYNMDKSSNFGLDENTLNNLGDLLSKVLKRRVELRFMNIRNPYLNRTIIAEYIGKNASIYNFRRLKINAIRKTKIIKYFDPENILESNLPSNMVGMKIIFSGRLKTERIRPRKTVSTAKIGTFTRNNDLFMEYGTYTGKNVRGAFTVKVCFNHKKGKNYI